MRLWPIIALTLYNVIISQDLGLEDARPEQNAEKLRDLFTTALFSRAVASVGGL